SDLRLSVPSLRHMPPVHLDFKYVDCKDIEDRIKKKCFPSAVGGGDMMIPMADGDIGFVVVNEEDDRLRLSCKGVGFKHAKTHSIIVKVGRKVITLNGDKSYLMNLRVPGEIYKIPFKKKGVKLRDSALLITVPLPSDPSKVLIHARFHDRERFHMLTLDTESNTFTHHPNTNYSSLGGCRFLHTPKACDWGVVGSRIHLIHTDRVFEKSIHNSFDMETFKWHKHGKIPFEVYSPAVISAGHYLLVIGGLDHER
ncbi:hypothetical protein KIPB_013917, partial [Kipferlia bialata]